MLATYRHRIRDTLAGVLISVGGPPGLLLLRMIVLRRYSFAAIWSDIASNSLIYLYISVTTILAFALFGYVLGRQTDRLQQLSTTDALTGIFNRRALSADLEHECRRSRRYGSPLSVLLVDVDQLKRVNDLLGHAAGDKVLRGFAAAITSTLRATDIGGRWGGDEFLIIAPATAGPAAAALADRLQFELAKQETFGAAKATASVGVATFDQNHRLLADSDALLQAADTALLRAKAAGRNQVTVAQYYQGGSVMKRNSCR
jgi:diguanylate cyclase (GGDEF)-like protein